MDDRRRKPSNEIPESQRLRPHPRDRFAAPHQFYDLDEVAGETQS